MSSIFNPITSLQSEITLMQMTICLIASLVIGFVISMLYRFNSKSLSVEYQFSFTLISVTMVVATVMTVIGTNITLSLGLIGALSIIRFRAVIKNTVDMAYLFWTISEGLAIGSKNYLVAAMSTIAIGFVMTVMSRYGLLRQTNKNYIVTFRLGPNRDGLVTVESIMREQGIRFSLKSSFLDNKSEKAEYTYELFSLANDGISQLNKQVENAENIESLSVLSPETNLYI